jgi:methylenetetrahydrofolate--tRNA-(uracil-5-)-methyltransferase
MADLMNTIHIVGGGLAGAECAFQIAERGHKVILFEMRGQTMTPAHKTDRLAELVCSNSLGSQTDYSAPGQLKWEAERLGSLILKAAREASVPAGMALGVDRNLFAEAITKTLSSHPNIEIRRELINSLDEVPRPAVIATGPLTHESLAQSIANHLRSENEDTQDFLYFFDAIAPIIDADSIDMNIAWRADRWDKGTGDYLNCPLTKDEYFNLVNAIKKARKIEPKEFEKTPYFDACMPIEAIVERGDRTLRFGPLSPKGLPNPKTGKTAYAVVQLRQENREATCYNMVGFQTKMAYPDQKEVFRMIPGLENAEFLKLGSMHRNMYIHTPKKLSPTLTSKKDSNLYFAGQITGVEGYFDSTCIGLLVALFIHDELSGKTPRLPPRETALGSLLNAITEDKKDFQPTNINFGLFPLLGMNIKTKEDREKKRALQLERAKSAFNAWINN